MTQLIGLDIGATKLAAGLVDPATGAVDDLTRIPTDASRGGHAVLRDCIALVEKVAGETAVEAVGIGICELVDPDGGVQSAHTFDWRHLDVAAAFAHVAPARVESDVRAAALAESAFGAGRDLSSFLYVNAGSGISSCFVLDGTPVVGARGNAILIGAGPLDVEDVAGGTAIEKSLGKPAAEAGEDEDPVLERAGEALGTATAFAVNLLDPAAVVVGGSLILGSRAYRAAFERGLKRHIWAELTRDLPVVSGECHHSGVVGAALATQLRAVVVS